MGKSHLIVSMYLDLGLDFIELDGASPHQLHIIPGILHLTTHNTKYGAS